MIQANDCILVVGSCGVWEHLTNEEVGLIVLQYYETMQAEAAANAVLNAAFSVQRSTKNTDDITVIVIFFDKKLIIKNMQKTENTSTLLQDILSSENVIEELDEESLVTGNTFQQSNKSPAHQNIFK